MLSSLQSQYKYKYLLQKQKQESVLWQSHHDNTQPSEIINGFLKLTEELAMMLSADPSTTVTH